MPEFGVWYPDQLRAAQRAYAEVIRRLAISTAAQRERETIAWALLKLTGDGRLDGQALVNECIASLYPDRASLIGAPLLAIPGSQDAAAQ